MHRKATSLALVALFAFGAATPGPTLAQGEATTGIELTLAEWLEPWEATGGWVALPAGASLGKGPVLFGDPAANLAPGPYDLYWVQNANAEFLPIATNVEVVAGERTEVRVTTGVALEIADWVLPRDPDNGVFGVLLPETTDFSFYAQSSTANTLFLPPGDYYVYYQPGGEDDRPPAFIGVANVEGPFGGLGVEIAIEDGRVAVVRALPGGAAEAAGVQAGDIILDVGGTPLIDLELTEAGALLRGEPGTTASVTIRRGKEAFPLAIDRVTVEPHRTIQANSGIQLVTEAGIFAPDGWWGVAFAGNTVNGFDDLINWEIGTNGGPMLLGPTAYDIYWNPDGVGPPELIRANVQLDGELIEIEVTSPR